MEDAILPSDWISPRERFVVTKKSLEPKVDELVSEAVGKRVFALDPRLLSLIVKWKKEDGKGEDSMRPDNFLNDPRKLAELREAFK